MNAPHLAGLALALAALVACGGDDECSIAAIQAELDDANAGSTVTFPANCRVEGSLVVPAGVRLEGASGAELAVTATSALGVELGAGAELAELAIEARGRAAVVARGDATLSAVAVDLRHGIGLYLTGGNHTLSDVTLTGPVTAANAADATWVNVVAEPDPDTGCTSATLCACEPGSIVSETEVCDETGRVVTWAPTIGIYARDATLGFDGVMVAGLARYGVVADGTELTWNGGGVRDVVGVGILFRGGRSTLTDVAVSGAVSGLRGVPSYGILATEGHAQTTTRTTVEAGERFGLVSLDGQGTHTDLTVQGNGDVGLWIGGSDAFDVRGASTVAANGVAGVAVLDSTGVTLDGLAVTGTVAVTRPVGSFGSQTIGDGIQLVGANEAVLRGVTLSGNERVGLLVDVVPGLTFEAVEVSATGDAFGALGGAADLATGDIVVGAAAWDTGITRRDAALVNDPTATGGFDALVVAEPAGVDAVVGIVGPMY
ncbi:MAG: hypothetical protein CMN30_25075 [Sandaracinus sp.]|nr:hypothetical protein [Sandaracinus sp.]